MEELKVKEATIKDEMEKIMTDLEKQYSRQKDLRSRFRETRDAFDEDIEKLLSEMKKQGPCI